ncbi:hypothetical protein L6232_24350, partial [Shewanella sp. C31]|nr:hypothetical protein [Shewanella electrica]
LCYLAVEREPLPQEVRAQIALPRPGAEAVFGEILSAWPRARFLGPWGELRLLFGDVREVRLPAGTFRFFRIRQTSQDERGQDAREVWFG